ncbi:Site-specific DNA recombinase [Eubacterium ruminantium]|nr:Site-specific DNA recombinase [Eubacterium ruminantium]
MEKRDDATKDANVIKQKIRERYKGVSEDVLDVIPANPQEDFYKSDTQKRVAVYARVSTDDPNQTSSYELQKNHYEDLVNRRPNWTLVDIYADEGISGTSLQHRDSFIRMINDCRAGKIDLIVTKSVSRFARNIIDCIGYVRQLKASDPPIGIFFETENIFTLDENSEMSLSFIATLAQEESHTKSEIMNASIEMRFKRGIFLTPVLLGYDHDEDGNLVINEDEANTVRLIFFSYLYGYSTQKIADALTELERLTKKGNLFWSAGSVLQILTNERYCGDILARKTFTPNYLNHKSKKNNHDRNQYRQKEHHEAIISREDFFAVQKMIRNAKYGNKGYFPEMHVINSGLLKGFVTVHPKWAGFTEDDFYLASDSIFEGVSCIPSKPIELSVNKGDLDLSGYELVRTQFMTSFGQASVTISSSTLLFNKASIDKMNDTQKIELLVMPGKQLFAIRKAPSGSRYALEWCKKA